MEEKVLDASKQTRHAQISKELRTRSILFHSVHSNVRLDDGVLCID